MVVPSNLFDHPYGVPGVLLSVAVVLILLTICYTCQRNRKTRRAMDIEATGLSFRLVRVKPSENEEEETMIPPPYVESQELPRMHPETTVGASAPPYVEVPDQQDDPPPPYSAEGQERPVTDVPAAPPPYDEIDGGP